MLNLAKILLSTLGAIFIAVPVFLTCFIIFYSIKNNSFSLYKIFIYRENIYTSGLYLAMILIGVLLLFLSSQFSKKDGIK